MLFHFWRQCSAFIWSSFSVDLESPALYSLCSDLLGAAEEVLPSLKKLGSRVLILRDNCDVEGIESLSEKIRQASDEPLPPQLRATITLKSPALYIYTSGTTGNLAFTSDLRSFLGVQTLSDRLSAIKIFCSQRWHYRSGLPKAAVISQERVWMASFLQSIAGVRADDILYLYLPLYHSSGFLMGLCGAIEKGDLLIMNTG